MKTCNQCKTDKAFSAFHSQKNGKFGLRGMCIECHKVKRREQYTPNLKKSSKDAYYEKHEERKAYAKEWYRANKDRLNAKLTPEEHKEHNHNRYVRRMDAAKAASKQRYAANREEAKAYARNRRAAMVLTDEQRAARAQYRKAHYAQNKAKVFEYSVRRARTKKQQTPAWADLMAMRRIYARCIELNTAAGHIAYHVDHVVPLRGKLVSGLHVQDNLRIVSAKENLKKGTNHVDS